MKVTTHVSTILGSQQHLLSTCMAGIYPQCKHVQFLSLEILPNSEDFMPIQTHNPKTCILIQQFSAKSLNKMTSCNYNLLCRF
jgi:hypothetical protein